MKKILASFFSLFLPLFALAVSNVMELKGKRIIFPPLIEIQRGSFYTADVLNKMKFEDKYEYNELVFGDTLEITDVKHINVGDKKNEKVLLMMLHKGNPIVFHLPLYINTNDNRIYRNFYGKGKTDVGFTSVSEIIPFESVRLCYYDADLIDSINSEWLHHIIYPRDTEFAKIYGEHRLETERMTKYEPYIFLGFEFLDTENRNGNFEMLNAVFSNRMGIKYFLPINGAQSDESQYGHLLSNLTNAFYSDSELQNHCKQTRNSALIDSVQNNFVGSEVYIDK